MRDVVLLVAVMFLSRSIFLLSLLCVDIWVIVSIVTPIYKKYGRVNVICTDMILMKYERVRLDTL